MNANLVFGLLLGAAVAAGTAPSQPTVAQDPCAFARRIAYSQPCVKESDCDAVELWRGAYGVPRSLPATAGRISPELAARLPKSEVSLGAFRGTSATLRRLAEASGLEVSIEPGAEEGIWGTFGPLSLDRAWREVLRAAGLDARLEGDRVIVSRAAGDPQPEPHAGSFAPSFNCPAH